MKAFISQPMNGKTMQEIISERAALEKNLKAIGYDVIPYRPIPECDETIRNRSVYCLGESVKEMSCADVVFFMPGYRNARGCMREMSICRAYDIPVKTLGRDDALLDNVTH